MIGIPTIMTLSRRDVQEIRMLAVLMLKIPRQLLEQRFAEENIDLTMLQHHVMHMVERHQPTNADLSKMFGLDPSTLVPIVDSLVKKGYLRRERDPNDRRRYPLYLTDEGKALQAHVGSFLGDDPLLKALEVLATDDLATLRDSLRMIVQHLPDGAEALAELDANLDAHEAEPDC